MKRSNSNSNYINPHAHISHSPHSKRSKHTITEPSHVISRTSSSSKHDHGIILQHGGKEWHVDDIRFPFGEGRFSLLFKVLDEQKDMHVALKLEKEDCRKEHTFAYHRSFDFSLGLNNSIISLILTCYLLPCFRSFVLLFLVFCSSTNVTK